MQMEDHTFRIEIKFRKEMRLPSDTNVLSVREQLELLRVPDKELKSRNNEKKVEMPV